MKAVISFAIFLLGIGVGALAEDAVVQFEPVDLASTLPGNAYFLSRGPYKEAEVSSDLGVNKGSRALRVTLFECEAHNWIWVESVFFNRAGGAHVEWCSSLSEAALSSQLRLYCRFSQEGFRWLDATTFEFYNDQSEIDTEQRKLVQEPRRLRIQLRGEGVFLVTGMSGS